MNNLSQLILNIYLQNPCEWTKAKYAKQFRDWFEASFVEGRVCQDDVTCENWTIELWNAIDSQIEWDKIQEAVDAQQESTLRNREISIHEGSRYRIYQDLPSMRHEAWRDEQFDRYKSDIGF